MADCSPDWCQMAFLEPKPIAPQVPPGKSPFLQWPNLGGKLTILNALGWATLFGLTAYPPIQPPVWAAWPLIFLAIVLSFPILWVCFIPLASPRDPFGIVLICFLLGINSIVWGYGLAWLWPKLRAGIQLVSIRSYRVMVAALFCISAALGWYCWTLYQEEQAFSLIESRCRAADDSEKNAPNGVEAGIDLPTLHALVRDYGDYIKQVGPRLEPTATHDYQQALKQMLGRLRKEGLKDLGDDPKAWMKEYGFD
jgi:hypothetical protein